MSKKRSSAESSYDEEQRTQDSDTTPKEEDDTKRPKLYSSSDTTLFDLPMELLESIFVKTVTMEVRKMKLSKAVWKDKADEVLNRLRTVCWQWNDQLSTNFFRNELHRVIDSIAPETIRLEVLHESLVGGFVLRVTATKDDIIMFCAHHHMDDETDDITLSFDIAIYDCNDITGGKYVLTLSEMNVCDIAGCSVSNCLYVEDSDEELDCSSIYRLTRNEEYLYEIEIWISDLKFPVYHLTVSANGSLITMSRPDGSGPERVSIYGPNGFLQHEVTLSPDIEAFGCIQNLIQKSNGNLVVQLVSKQLQVMLAEIDETGIAKRQYISSLGGMSAVNFVDAAGRILIHDPDTGMELLDSEFNRLGFTGPKLNLDNVCGFYSLYYHSERDEVLGVCADDPSSDVSALAIFRFVEE